MSIKNYFTKKQNTYLKVLQLRYWGRDSIIQVRNRPYFHYGPFGRTKNKMEVVQTYKTSCRHVTYSRFGQFVSIVELIMLSWQLILLHNFHNMRVT